MSTFIPTYREESIVVLVGTVGGGAMTNGSPNLSNVGFTPLPGRLTAEYFSAADVGRIVTVLGAGVGGGILVAKILTFVDTQNVVLTVAASTSVPNTISNTTIFRPVDRLANSVMYNGTITGHDEAGFAQRLLNGALPVVAGQPFLLTSTDPAVGTGTYGTFAGGEIDTVEAKNYPGTAGVDDAYAECRCVSYETILSRRVVQAKRYSAQTMKQIAQDIIDRGLTAEYCGLSSPNGPTPSSFTVENLSYVSEALSNLMSECSTLTSKYFYKVDQWRTITIALQAATGAPWSIVDGISDGNVLAAVSNAVTRAKFANQVYTHADKGLGDALVDTVVNSFNGSALPFYRSSIVLRNKPAIPPTITVGGVAKAVWVSPTDPRNDTTAISMPGGYDWAWAVDSDYLFIPVPTPSGPNGIPPGATAVVTYYTAAPAQSLYSYLASIGERAAVQGGSGLHEVVINVEKPIHRSELDTQTESAAKAFGVLSQSVSAETMRGGLVAGMGITTGLPDVGADATFLVESVSLAAKDGWPVWTVKCTIGAVIGEWDTALADVLGRSGFGVRGGVSGLTPLAPAAPDLVSGTAAVFSREYGNKVQFGFSGQFVMPTDFSNILLVEVTAVNATTHKSVVIARIADLLTATTLYSGIVGDRPASNETWEVRIVPYNTDGVPNLPGVVITGLAVTAVPAVTSVTAAEVPSTLEADVSRLVSTQVSIVPVISNSEVPVLADYWFSQDNGVTYVWQGAKRLTAVGQAILTRVLKAATALTCKVAVSVGPVGGDPSIFLPAASLPSTAVVSTAFPIGALVKPAANLVTSLIVSAGAGGTFPYMRGPLEPNGYQDWVIASIGFNDAAASLDANAAFATLTAQDYDASDNPIGPEHKYGTIVVTGFGVRVLGDLSGPYGAEAVPPRSGDIAKVGLRLYLSSRKNQADDAWSDTTTSALQTSIGTGGLLLVVVAVGGAVPPGMIPAGDLDPSTLGENLGFNPAGHLAGLNSIGDNLLNNPGFDQGDQGWQFFSAGGANFTTTTGQNHTVSGARSLTFDSVVGYGGAAAARQRIPCDPGDVISVRWWAKGDASNQVQTLMTVSFLDAAGALIVQNNLGGVNGIPTVWTRYSGVTPVAPAGAVSATIDVYAAWYTTPGTGNAYFDDVYCVRLRGDSPAVVPTAGGGYSLRLSGPMYTDVADALSVRISGDFVVTGGPTPTLSQNIVDLGKATNFSTEFTQSGGIFLVNALGVNKLIAGDALFAGQATFAYLGGGKVTINSVGITLADHYTSPTCTVTVSAAGVTVARGTNNLQVTSANIFFSIGGTIPVVIDSSSITLSKGGSSVTITASAVTIVNGSLNSPVINGGSLTITASPITISINQTDYVKVTNSGSGIFAQQSYAAFRVQRISDTFAYAQVSLSTFQASTGAGGRTLSLNPDFFSISGLPSIYPGPGTKQFWYDPADSNRVKFAS